MSDLYCRKCGGNYKNFGAITTSTICQYVAERCCWCGTDFWEASPTKKNFLNPEDYDIKCVAAKEAQLKAINERLQA